MNRGEFWFVVALISVIQQGGWLVVAVLIAVDLLLGYLSELVGKKWD
jgi:hypothetical protein